jgi:elongation factor P--beta-lysine ligase
MHCQEQYLLHEATDLVRKTTKYNDPHASWRARCWLVKSVEVFARSMNVHGTLSKTRQAALTQALELLRENATAEEDWDGLLAALCFIKKALEPETSMSSAKQDQASAFDIEAFLKEAQKCHHTLPVWLSSKHLAMH